MSRWECRRCEGGFPEPVKRNGYPACPWCGQRVGKAIGFEMREVREMEA